ncbi:hypothetical protein SPBR_01804 [Sporothrix brasiliensis 5110]|uniref:Uncharacterized protein n=1 Tax=Sporothrix brasiliensis 5110 TaxID=1398154 RepID=A0A0C2IXL6_9PEZI|nr:uncharacterized protein SPBR_01804 [Sporothrix brasiliensis 5110]KIH91490.1 hypothetical protein SPBR_01804 [Sporothrix brasiliensis 5110]
MTLRDALVRHKPFVECKSRDTKNSKGVKWPRPSIRVWDQFTMATLNESYGHILDQPLPDEYTNKLPPTSSLNNLAVENDDGPKTLLAWNDDTVLPLVKWSKQTMGLHTGMAIRHSYSDASGEKVAKIPRNDCKKTVIDHIIGLGNAGKDTLVVGLGRTSSKWRASTLFGNLNPSVEERRWPLRQLANLCRASETRYGYIQTDDELVVCCFGSRGTQVQRGETRYTDTTWTDWTVAFMPVPWNTELSKGARHDVMTTELALWWLCMLSLSDGHRALVDTEDIVPINAWDIVWLDEDRGWIRRHRYSAVEEPTDAPPPPPYETPEVDNAAVFAAQVGINGESHFALDSLDEFFNFGPVAVGQEAVPAGEVVQPNGGYDGTLINVDVDVDEQVRQDNDLA